MNLVRRLFACTVAATALAVGIAPSAAAVPSTADSVTVAWYEDYLYRLQEDAIGDRGRQYWIDRMNAGLRGSDALWAITHSPEYNDIHVEYIYIGYLDRLPDDGARYWVDGTNAGRFPIEWVEQNVLASQEFADGLAGSSAAETRENITASWYVSVLGRDRGDYRIGEIRYWSERIRQNGRLGALRELWYSPEAIRSRINRWYIVYLGRDASETDLSYWYAKEVESDGNVQVLIGSSPEYVAAH